MTVVCGHVNFLDGRPHALMICSVRIRFSPRMAAMSAAHSHPSGIILRA